MKTLKWRDCKTDADRFAYHTHVYAWRLFRGHAQPGETTSPNDPTGQWYDADAVRAELANMQAEANRNRPKSTFRFIWLDADGKLTEPWRDYGKPQPKLAPRSRRASYPDDPT